MGVNMLKALHRAHFEINCHTRMVKNALTSMEIKTNNRVSFRRILSVSIPWIQFLSSTAQDGKDRKELKNLANFFKFGLQFNQLIIIRSKYLLTTTGTI